MTAIRCDISDIIHGKYSEEDSPRVVSPYGVEIRRAVLIGFVVGNYSSSEYATLTLDDGTGTIRVKGWGAEAEMLSQVNLYSLALVVGRVREYEGERYIVPEIIRDIPNSNYLTLHKLERLRTILERSGLTGIEPAEPEGGVEGPPLVVASPPSAEESVSSAPSPKGSSGMTGPLVKQILEFIRSSGGPVPNDEIIAYFVEKGFDKNDITLKILDLLDDGAIIEDPIGVYRCE